MDEKVIWKGSPSQWINLGTFILCGLFCWLIIPVLIAGWKYLVTRFTNYELTSERIIISKGVLSKTIDNIEYYRMKDVRLDQPLLLRLVGLSNLTLVSTDRINGNIFIEAIPNGPAVLEELRGSIENLRSRKNVRVEDYN